jgi:dolichol-phosphate mannosyltransferase
MSASNDRILVFIPAYNCGQQIPRVIAQLTALPADMSFQVLVLDNQSPDDTLARASAAIEQLSIPAVVGRNCGNFGLGGSHKTAFTYAIEQGFTHVIVLHGDDQGSIQDLVPYLQQKKHHQFDAFLGARFMPGSRLQGYSSFRTFGNRVYNRLFSTVAGQRFFDLGSGLNIYKTSSLAKQSWQGFANDLTFNYYMILAGAAWGWRMDFFPISWREDDQVSNVKLFKQARQTLKLLMRFGANRDSFLSERHAETPPSGYRFDVVSSRHMTT